MAVATVVRGPYRQVRHIPSPGSGPTRLQIMIGPPSLCHAQRLLSGARIAAGDGSASADLSFAGQAGSAAGAISRRETLGLDTGLAPVTSRNQRVRAGTMRDRRRGSRRMPAAGDLGRAQASLACGWQRGRAPGRQHQSRDLWPWSCRPAMGEAGDCEHTCRAITCCRRLSPGAAGRPPGRPGWRAHRGCRGAGARV
jgi:hypothetical protein